MRQNVSRFISTGDAEEVDDDEAENWIADE
jgi:hypothetical protein